MELYAALITAVAALIGVLGGYMLGNRRLRYERLYEQRALVIAKLSELLFTLQSDLIDRSSPNQLWQTDRFVIDSDLTDWSSPFHVEQLDRDEQQKNVAAVWRELAVYYRSNAVWLDPATCDRIDSFLKTAIELAWVYEDSLNESGHPRSAEARDAALRLIDTIPPLRRKLEDQFRTILYPPPWYDVPLRFLSWLHVKNRKSTDAGTADNE